MNDKKSIEEQVRREQQAAESNTPAYDGSALSFAEVEGLPQEVLESLSINKSDDMQFRIVDIINAAGKTLDLDRIIIGLWKQTHEKPNRQKTSALLRSAVAKGRLYSVPGRKAVYTTIDPSNES